MRTPKITRRLVAIGVIASVMVALTASLSSAAPIVRLMQARPLQPAPPTDCSGTISIHFLLLDDTSGEPVPLVTHIQLEGFNPNNGQPRTVALGTTDQNGNGNFSFAAGLVCNPRSRPPFAWFKLFWQDDGGNVFFTREIPFTSVNIQPPWPQRLDLGTFRIWDNN